MLNLARLLIVSVLLGFSASAQAQDHWVGSWATSQQLAEPRNSIATDDLKDVTLRQIVHLSIGGTTLRLRVSNRYGTTPLRLTSVHLAHAISADSSRIDPTSDVTLTFSGRPDVTVPSGADYLSDPLAYPMAPASNVAITIYLESIPVEQNGHPGSRSTSYLVLGNQISAVELPDATKIDHWYFIAGIDVLAAKEAFSIAVLGDSITDGRGSTTNANNRWTDILASRLRASPSTVNVAVLNHGLGGNRLLRDGLGPNALARFDHDVLSQAGVRYLLVLEGINDIGTLGEDGTASEHAQLVQQMIAAYEQLIMRAHTYGIKVMGCTILPFAGTRAYHPGTRSEGDRQDVNRWIRTPGHFDAVIDFDQIMRDPTNPDHLLLKFDSGDHLHPSPGGHAAMGEAVPLANFLPVSASLGKHRRTKKN